MRWIPIGKLGKTHGLKGEFRFWPEAWEDALLDSFRQVRLESDAPDAPFRTVSGLRGQGEARILKLEGIDRVEDAQPLVGQTLLVRETDFPPLPEGEYYRFQIEGLKAYDEDGRYYGTVTEIIQTGSNDVYVVQGDGPELLLPVIEDVIKEIDLDQHKLVFHVIEGLLEDHPL